MALSSASVFTVTLAIFCLSPLYRRVEAIGCSDVVNFLSPCMSYLDGGTVSDSCCYGVKRLYKASYTSEYDLREICTCLKQETSVYPQLTPDAVQAVTQKCGVQLPFKISTNIDCSALKLSRPNGPGS